MRDPRAVLCTKMLPVEAERVKAAAKKAGVSTSMFIRRVIIEAASKVKSTKGKTSDRQAAA